MGPDGNLYYRAEDPAIVYDDFYDRYLVVWTGDDDSGALMEDEDEIFGQLLDGATGAPTGPNDFRISFNGGTGNTTYAAAHPDVAFDGVHQRFLVVWDGDTDTGDLVDGEKEIFGQVLDAALATVGSNFRISTMGPDGDAAYDAERPAVAYNPERDEFLVVWAGDTNTGGLVDNEDEVWAQLVSDDGVLIGYEPARERHGRHRRRHLRGARGRRRLQHPRSRVPDRLGGGRQHRAAGRRRERDLRPAHRPGPRRARHQRRPAERHGGRGGPRLQRARPRRRLQPDRQRVPGGLDRERTTSGVWSRARTRSSRSA